MKRLTTEARPNWQNIVENQGFTFHSNGIEPDYINTWGTNWNESVYYEFTMDEILKIEAATNELQSMCMDACEFIVKNDKQFDRLQIPVDYREMIKYSWDIDSPTVYGRFDLAYDGNEIKMLEYNADTPTTLIESAIVQWFWKTQKFPEADQFNSIHEALIEQWKYVGSFIGDQELVFATNKESIEEYATTEYLRDTAHQAGLNTSFINISDVGWNGNYFVDMNEKEINFWFKLYPWEWLQQEQFGPYIPQVKETMGIIEPAWKMMLSNKGIIPILWELFPNNKYLLEASFFNEHKTARFAEYVQKPLLGREGCNINIYDGQGQLTNKTEGLYNENGIADWNKTIYQRKANLGKIDGYYSVFGSWIIGGDACGLIVRESTNPIIQGQSRVVPHIIRG